MQSDVVSLARHLPWVCLALLLTLAGCGGPDNVVKVQGRVTLDGQPLPDARLEFQPATGRASYGTTDANGDYSLSYSPDHDGAEIGSHTVRIQTRGQDPKKQPEILSAKYHEKSELKADVASGKNEINFDLKKK